MCQNVAVGMEEVAPASQCLAALAKEVWNASGTTILLSDAYSG